MGSLRVGLGDWSHAVCIGSHFAKTLLNEWAE